MTIQDKTIVITGGTSGIGYQMVRSLTPHNRVAVIARPGSKLDQLSLDFPQVLAYPADLTKPREYEAAADQITKDLGAINILVNNAAIQFTPTYLQDDFSYDTLEHEVHLNFTAVCALSYLLLPALLKSAGEAFIVNINSGLALAPKTSSAVYCATKAAVDTFSQSLGYQLENTNVRVIQAFLPLVDTPMTQGRGEGKISAERAAADILSGIARGTKANDIGKVKLLRVLRAVAPWLARRLMKRA